MSQVENGTCVFWQEAGLRNETGGLETHVYIHTYIHTYIHIYYLVIIFFVLGYWNTDGCETNNTGNEFICSCNHLSFFAVLVVNQKNSLFLNTGFFVCVKGLLHSFSSPGLLLLQFWRNALFTAYIFYTFERRVYSMSLKCA